MKKIMLPFNDGLKESLDKVIPVNPLTGLRDDLVHKYEIALTDSERYQIEQYLQIQNVSQPSHQLKDKDLIALCPSRYVSTLSDMRELAHAMRDVVKSLDAEDTSSSPAASDTSSVSN